jgi:hypothetical protein
VEDKAKRAKNAMRNDMRTIARLRIGIAGLLAISLFPTIGCTPHGMAQSDLEQLKTLNTSTSEVDDETFVKDIGFESMKDLERAQVGSPLRVYNVRLVELVKFQPDDDPEKLLHDTHRLVFPLMVDGRYVSSFTAMENEFFSSPKAWMPWKSARVTRAGFPRLIRKIHQLKSSDSSSVVYIPSLRILLLGDVNVKPLVLTVVDDNQYLKLKSGETHDAAELFSKIVPDAKVQYESDQQLRRGEQPITPGGAR